MRRPGDAAVVRGEEPHEHVEHVFQVIIVHVYIYSGLIFLRRGNLDPDRDSELHGELPERERERGVGQMKVYSLSPHVGLRRLTLGAGRRDRQRGQRKINQEEGPKKFFHHILQGSESCDRTVRRA